MATRRKNLQTPLGELITRARIEKGLTRAQLAKEIGIGENSLVRYEKAGLENDGQYPPSPKLAKLCFFLGISPTKALFGCLSNDDFEFDHYRMQSNEDWLMDHPDHEYLLDQWFALMEDNFKLANTIKLLLGPAPEQGSQRAEFAEWVRNEGRKVVEIQDAFYKRLADAGKHVLGEPLYSFSSNPSSNLWDYADFKRNGPEVETLDRYPNKPHDPEAAPTASPNDTKKGDDR